MNDPLLSVRGLQTCFATTKGLVRAVDGVSFDVRRGETFALLGESGCGKSITALSIMRLLPQPVGQITAGQILLNGENLLTLPEVDMRAVRGGRIAMIFQEPMTSLNPVLTVHEQIAESLARHKGLKGSAADNRVHELLDAVGIPAPKARAKEYPHQLSGGMKQRVMIAIALAGEPDLLIADEPTTALDVTIQAQVLELLEQLQRDMGMALLMITHDLGVVAEMADHIAVMYGGQVVEQACRDDFFASPAHPYSRKLFQSLPDMKKRDQPLAVIPGNVPSPHTRFDGCRFAPRCDAVWPLCRTEPPQWQSVNGDPEDHHNNNVHHVRCHLAAAENSAKQAALESKAGENIDSKTDIDAVTRPDDGTIANSDNTSDVTLLAVDELKVHFPIRKGLLKRTAGHVHAVDGVNLTIHRGQTVALVGESGCGKTTAGKAILQLTKATAGSICFEGDELTQLKGEALRRRRRDFQIIFQDPYSSMNPRMVVANIIEEGMQALRVGGNNSTERQARIDQLLQQVGLPTDSKYRYPHEFSGGQRQRICIARALAVEPKLIICDEPTSALDVSVQAQILNLLKSLQNRLGLSYLFITHNLSVVAYLADEVLVMYLGRIVERGTTDEVLNSAKHPYTQALLSAVPTIDTTSKKEIVRLEGDLPSPIDPPTGCHFHPRCPHSQPVCRERYPAAVQHSDSHQSLCHLFTNEKDDSEECHSET
ncbi:MAG: ABC transporter ATP-binding protein [Gammaproteobacteria bacterium]|nr:ABC transporter ATP-binding protein [Gammaproteobacteria bacterium]